MNFGARFLFGRKLVCLPFCWYSSFCEIESRRWFLHIGSVWTYHLRKSFFLILDSIKILMFFLFFLHPFVFLTWCLKRNHGAEAINARVFRKAMSAALAIKNNCWQRKLLQNRYCRNAHIILSWKAGYIPVVTIGSDSASKLRVLDIFPIVNGPLHEFTLACLPSHKIWRLRGADSINSCSNPF